MYAILHVHAVYSTVYITEFRDCGLYTVDLPWLTEARALRMSLCTSYACTCARRPPDNSGQCTQGFDHFVLEMCCQSRIANVVVVQESFIAALCRVFGEIGVQGCCRGMLAPHSRLLGTLW